MSKRRLLIRNNFKITNSPDFKMEKAEARTKRRTLSGEYVLQNVTVLQNLEKENANKLPSISNDNQKGSENGAKDNDHSQNTMSSSVYLSETNEIKRCKQYCVAIETSLDELFFNCVERNCTRGIPKSNLATLRNSKFKSKFATSRKLGKIKSNSSPKILAYHTEEERPKQINDEDNKIMNPTTPASVIDLPSNPFYSSASSEIPSLPTLDSLPGFSRSSSEPRLAPSSGHVTYAENIDACTENSITSSPNVPSLFSSSEVTLINVIPPERQSNPASTQTVSPVLKRNRSIPPSRFSPSQGAAIGERVPSAEKVALGASLASTPFALSFRDPKTLGSRRRNSTDSFADSPIKGLVVDPTTMGKAIYVRPGMVSKSGARSIEVDVKMKEEERIKPERPKSRRVRTISFGKGQGFCSRNDGRVSPDDAAWESPKNWFSDALDSSKPISTTSTTNKPLSTLESTAKASCKHHPNYSALRNLISCFRFPKPSSHHQIQNSRNSAKQSHKCLFSQPHWWSFYKKPKLNRIKNVDSHGDMDSLVGPFSISSPLSEDSCDLHGYENMALRPSKASSPDSSERQRSSGLDSEISARESKSNSPSRAQTNSTCHDRITTKSCDSRYLVNDPSFRMDIPINNCGGNSNPGDSASNCVKLENRIEDDSLVDLLNALEFESNKWLHDLNKGKR